MRQLAPSDFGSNGTGEHIFPYLKHRVVCKGLGKDGANASDKFGGEVMQYGANGSNGTGNRSLPRNGDSHVQEVVKTAHEELRQLMRQRAEIMKRIGTLKQTIFGLANLFGDDILGEDLLELVDRKTAGRQPGFTKACRMVLMEAGRPLAVREVCEQIQQRLPAVLLRHKDPLASVTTVLNRLVDYGEALSVVRENGRRAWQWASDPTAVEQASSAHAPISQL
jgi:hypothetical protein